MVNYSIVVVSESHHMHTLRLLDSLSLLNYDKNTIEVVIVSSESAQVINWSGFKCDFLLRPIFVRDGLSRAKSINIAVKDCGAERVLLLDGDCVVSPDLLNRYDEFFSTGDNSFALGTVGFVADAAAYRNSIADGDLLAYQAQFEFCRDYRSAVKDFYQLECYSSAPASWASVLCSNICVKREFFIDLGGFNEQFLGVGCEAIEFAYRLVKRKARFNLIPNPVLLLVDHEGVYPKSERYVSWVGDLALFYSTYHDPAVLLLMKYDDIGFNYHCVSSLIEPENRSSAFRLLSAELGLFLPKKDASRLTLGIVATVSDAAGAIEQFIRYHLRIGFHKIYLFIDDNDPLTCTIARRFSEVEVIMRDESLFELWKNTETFNNADKRALIDHEVMIRQEMNFFVAHSRAKVEEVDWLVHLDLDELFFPNGTDLQSHFKSLQYNQFRSMTYLNYESISTAVDTSSIYLSSIFFKINYFKNRYWFITEDQKKLLKQESWLKEKFFNFYKMANHR